MAFLEAPLISQGETIASGNELSLGKALLTYITLYFTATYLALTTRSSQ